MLRRWAWGLSSEREGRGDAKLDPTGSPPSVCAGHRNAQFYGATEEERKRPGGGERDAS